MWLGRREKYSKTWASRRCLSYGVCALAVALVLSAAAAGAASARADTTETAAPATATSSPVGPVEAGRADRSPTHRARRVVQGEQVLCGRNLRAWGSVEAAGGTVKIWWSKKVPADRRDAEALADYLTRVAWRAVASKAVLGKAPLLDHGSQRHFERCQGPDTAIDILIVGDIEKQDICGLAYPHSEAGATSGHILLNRSFPLDARGKWDLKMCLVHELTHLSQYAYDIPRRHQCFLEGVATWASHVVRRKYNRVEAKLFRPSRIHDNPCGVREPYAAYTLWMFLQHNYPTTTSMATLTYRKQVATRQSSRRALRATLTEAGYDPTDVFAEYALAYWNGDGLEGVPNSFRSVGDVTRGAYSQQHPTYGPPLGSAPLQVLTTTPPAESVLPGAARYFTLDLSADPNVQGIVVADPDRAFDGEWVNVLLIGAPGGLVIAGAQLTPGHPLAICLPKAAPGATKAVVTVSNGTFGGAEVVRDPRALEVSAHRGCRWPVALHGTVSGSGAGSVVTFDDVAESTWSGSLSLICQPAWAYWDYAGGTPGSYPPFDVLDCYVSAGSVQMSVTWQLGIPGSDDCPPRQETTSTTVSLTPQHGPAMGFLRGTWESDALLRVAFGTLMTESTIEEPGFCPGMPSDTVRAPFPGTPAGELVSGQPGSGFGVDVSGPTEVGGTVTVHLSGDLP